jgi:hypothetical protein
MMAFDLIWTQEVEQLLYGGAAGGGKSYFLRALAYHLAMVWRGSRVAIFRENATQLDKTHIPAFRREMAAAGYEIDKPGVWNNTSREFRLPNGSVIEFLHIDQSIGAEKWLSAEWSALLVDESTQLNEVDLRMLYSRVRATVEQKTRWKNWRPLAVFATNPGGKSHIYFKEEFVDPALESDSMSWEVTDEVEVGGVMVDTRIKRAFSPAFLSDNPSLDFKQYVSGLAQLPRARREQMLSGDWDFFEGKVFDMLNPEIHLVDREWADIGRDWPRAMGLDHGTTSPTAALWTARDDDGFYITYQEYYSPGRVTLHVETIRQMMLADGHRELRPYADPRMWHKVPSANGMYSIAGLYLYGGMEPESAEERMEAQAHGIHLIQSKMQREHGRMVLERLLEPDPNRMFPFWHPRGGEYGAPQLFIARQCANLWRELSNLRYVEDSEETVKEDDHAYDALYRSVPMLELSLMKARNRGPRRQLVTA